MSLRVFECTRCGTRVFPRRYFCRSCGNGQWRAIDVTEGTVEETTVVRHRTGSAGRPPTTLATVITRTGPVVIARLEAPAERGEVVRLQLEDNGRIVARQQSTLLP